jgi:hypothetical protein
MATFFRNKVVKNVGTVPVTITTMNASQRSTVIGMSLTNLTDGFVYASVLVKDDTSVEGYYAKDVPIAQGTSLRIVNQGEKLILAPENEISVVSNVDDSLDVILSYVEVV